MGDDDMKQLIGQFFVATLTIISLGACASGQMQPTATVTSSGGPGMGQAQQEAYNGPKARIAVNKFTNKAAKGGRQIGAGMSDMLTTALFHTNRFIVLDRQDHGAVMAEQDLAASGRISQKTAAPIGQMEGAELLVTGAITEFEPRAGGGFGGIGLGPVGIGGSTNNAHIAMDLKVVDTKTGRIVAAVTIEGRASEWAAGLIAGVPIPVIIGGYQNTPMEKAIRVCIKKAADYLASQTPASYYH